MQEILSILHAKHAGMMWIFNSSYGLHTRDILMDAMITAYKSIESDKVFLDNYSQGIYQNFSTCILKLKIINICKAHI